MIFKKAPVKRAEACLNTLFGSERSRSAPSNRAARSGKVVFNFNESQHGDVADLLPGLIWTKVREFAAEMGVSLPLAQNRQDAERLIRARSRVRSTMLNHSIDLREGSLIVAGELVVWDNQDGSAPIFAPIRPPVNPRTPGNAQLIPMGV